MGYLNYLSADGEARRRPPSPGISEILRPRWNVLKGARRRAILPGAASPNRISIIRNRLLIYLSIPSLIFALFTEYLLILKYFDMYY